MRYCNRFFFLPAAAYCYAAVTIAAECSHDYFNVPFISAYQICVCRCQIYCLHDRVTMLVFTLGV
jgi:hypothetical protein